ncbi:MAG TPA: hypothetical protein PK275_05750 [Chitinophagaceae bacterium]|nr:hypothetical protein [Chitinophagaceae bacterium]
MSNPIKRNPSSYRDPSGYIFEKDGVLFRQVNKCFKEDFEFFIQSGLYDSLVNQELLLPHQTIEECITGDENGYLTLLPERINFISYAWEWSFDMLKDAALLTLRLAKESIQYGLSLKDATPHNIQWHNGKLIFIDTLSFEKYNEATPWIAYRQFCESFLAPLLLMHYNKQTLNQLHLAWPDGIPLSVTAKLLPTKTKYSLHTYLHIHLHAKISKKTAGKSEREVRFSKNKFLNLIQSLELLIRRLKTPTIPTQWSAYYDEAINRNGYLEQKKKIITNWLSLNPQIKSAADIGANQGVFSLLLSEKKINTLAADFDPSCINNLYQQIKKQTLQFIQPIIFDLSNPSPAIGVQNNERESFTERLKVDLVMVLAILHHLAIGKNIPFAQLASYFSTIAPLLIIEFIPKEDEKVKLILSQKKDIFSNYSQTAFEKEFSFFFRQIEKQEIGTSGRTLYFMKRNEE